MCEIISMFPFILTIVFLHHDLAKLKPAWFCSRCSVVSGYSVIKNLAPITIYDTFRYAADDLSQYDGYVASTAHEKHNISFMASGTALSLQCRKQETRHAS